MFRKPRQYHTGFSQGSYSKAIRKLKHLSVRELLYQLDQYLTEMLTVVNAYQHNNREELLLEMKRDLVTLMAVVDELHEEYSARRDIINR